MKPIRLWSIVMMTLLGSVMLTSCGKFKPHAQPGTLRWMTTGTISTLDPSKAVDMSTQQTIYNTFTGLVAPNGGNHVKLAIAKDYHVSADGKTYVFNLKHTQWSNGQPLTANDFVYGIRRSANPKTASQEAYYMDHIVNYNQVAQGKLPLNQLGVRATGKYQLQIQLIKPQPYFINILTLPIFYPQSQAVVRRYGNQYGTNSQRILSNGAFKVANWSGSSDSWNLVKNPHYYQAPQTKLNRIKYTVIKTPQTALNEYQSGLLDQTLLSGKLQYAYFKKSPALHLRKSYTVKYITMNAHQVPALNNINIRRALSQMVDRRQMINNILGDGSIMAKGMVPDTLSYHHGRDFNDDATVPAALTYNASSARRLWRLGMHQLHRKSLRLNLTAGNDDETRALTEFLQTQWQRLPGLSINVQSLPSNVATSRFLHSQFQLHVAAWDPSISDPISPLNTKYSGNAMNTAKWHNTQYDQLIDRSNNQDALYPNRRWQDLVNAQKILMQQQAIIPLYQTVQPELIRTNVHGVRYFGNGPIWDFSKAYVK